MLLKLNIDYPSINAAHAAAIRSAFRRAVVEVPDIDRLISVVICDSKSICVRFLCSAVLPGSILGEKSRYLSAQSLLPCQGNFRNHRALI